MTRPLAPEAAKPDRDRASDQRGRLVILARFAWIAAAMLAVSLFAAGLPAEFALLREPCPDVRCFVGQLPAEGFRALADLGLTPDFYAGYFVVLDATFAAVCCAVAALIFWRRSDDPMGVFVSLAVLSRLGARLESTLAPDAVLPAVTRTLREALKLPYAEIQLRREDGFETAASAGAPVQNALSSEARRSDAWW